MEYMTTDQIIERCEDSARALEEVQPSEMGASMAVTQAVDVLRWAASRLHAMKEKRSVDDELGPSPR